MTRREVITKAIDEQLSWVAAADIIGVTPRQMRRIRRAVERDGMSAVMDQRGGRPRRKRVRAQTLREICRLKRGMYADFSMRHFYERLTEQHGIAVSYTYVRQVLQHVCNGAARWPDTEKAAQTSWNPRFRVFHHDLIMWPTTESMCPATVAWRGFAT